MLEILRFDPTPCGYPKPRIPVLPKRLQLRIFNEAHPANEGGFRSFARGRYALCAAYELAGIKSGTTLLAPAYHCLTMLDPAIHLGADVQLYALNPDLSPDFERLDSLLVECTLPAKALVATHFFGIRQDFTRLRQWCRQRDIVLIEDCSHALFTEGYRAPGIGLVGSFAVSSPYKFFPCEDGGLLQARDEATVRNVRTAPPSLKDELRASKRTLEHHAAALGALPGNLDQQLAALLSRPKTLAKTVQYSCTAPSLAFSPNLIDQSASRVSRWLVRRTAPESIAEKRRVNFTRWLDATRELVNCRPLYSRLPEDCVPYMFPLHIEHPQPHFDLLKQLGVPVWRWDEMAISACPVATDYRLHLLHLPCHQSLTDAQMDWLVNAIQKVLQTPADGTY